MARLVLKPGDVLKFPLANASQHGYAQWLSDGTARIFLVASTADLALDEILSLPVAFRVLLFKDTPNRYHWSKVGRAHVPEAYSQPQRYVKKDPITKKLRIYFDGCESPTTEAEVSGLETLAVWAHPHVVERLDAQLSGTESKVERSLR